MTAPELLALIAGALLLQLGAGIGWTLRRHRLGGAESPPAAPAAMSANPVAAWVGWREFRVWRRAFEDEAQSQCSFYLQPVDGQPLPPFKPGQFLTFALDVTVRGADGSAAARSITRCYSLSDRPDPARYRVTVKRVPAPADQPGVASGLASCHFHDHVRVGDILRVKAPAGHFFIDPSPDVPAVLIAGGIGITPMMSMLRWCIAEQPRRQIHLYYGVRNGRDHGFRQALGEMAASHAALHLNVVYSRPGPTDLPGRDYQHEGHVDIDLIRRTLPHGPHRFHVCGPSQMMQTLVPALATWGVPVDHLRYEAFGPATVKLPGAAPPEAPAALGLEVRFQRSGRSIEWDGLDGSLLDFAERHGVEVESGCRSGGCGACEIRLLEGRVQYEHAPDHDVAPGHCLLCVGRPSTSLVLEA